MKITKNRYIPSAGTGYENGVLVSCPTNSHNFSVPYKVFGKARLAGNGHSPWQEAQHRQRPCRARPSGACVRRYYGVALLAKMDILAAKRALY
jgi:hypothetical protein